MNLHQQCKNIFISFNFVSSTSDSKQYKQNWDTYTERGHLQHEYKVSLCEINKDILKSEEGLHLYSPSFINSILLNIDLNVW